MQITLFLISLHSCISVSFREILGRSDEVLFVAAHLLIYLTMCLYFMLGMQYQGNSVVVKLFTAAILRAKSLPVFSREVSLLR